MQRFLSLTLVGALVVAFGGCKSKEEVEADKAALKAELDKLQGKWKVASRTADAEADDDAPAPSSYFVIEGDILKLVFVDKDGKDEVIQRQKMVIGHNKDPKTVDLIYVDENGKEITATSSTRSRGKTKTKKTTLKDAGIYKLDGDKLQFCISFDEKNRPTDFTAPAKSARYVLTLQKMKDGDKIESAKDDDAGKDKPKDGDAGKDKPKDGDAGKDKPKDVDAGKAKASGGDKAKTTGKAN